MSSNGVNGAGSASSKLISPTELCHIVLKTTPQNHKTMISWWLQFLGGKVVSFNDRISFITYDHKDHRIAIVAAAPDLQPDASKSVGLAHVCFGFDTLDDLATSYEQKITSGIINPPTWCVNHGMTTSMYYMDPDGNGVETQVDNFDTAEECMSFIESESFAANSIGVDYDPKEFVQRVRNGDDQAMLKKRPDIGPRKTRDENTRKVLSVA